MADECKYHRLSATAFRLPKIIPDYAVRSVLIGSVVGLAVNIVINVWGTMGGWLNGNAWGSTVVLVLLLIGGAYQLWIGARKSK